MWEYSVRNAASWFYGPQRCPCCTCTQLRERHDLGGPGNTVPF